MKKQRLVAIGIKRKGEKGFTVTAEKICDHIWYVPENFASHAYYMPGKELALFVASGGKCCSICDYREPLID